MSNKSGQVDVIVIGAGFAGLLAIHKLREMGLSVQCFERGTGVGGTWYWNRYPGARCDSETPVYSYFFDDEMAKEWIWPERYPTSDEILKYLNWAADRLDLRRSVRFNTEVTALTYDEATNLWKATTSAGGELSAKYVITAAGCLSEPQKLNIPGIDDFAGETYFTSRWPHEKVDFTGKRVAVIGTGSTGIQTIPVVAQEAAHVTVFQRTPNYSVPAKNRPLTDAEKKEFASNFAAYRQGALSSNGGHLPRVPGPHEDEIGTDEKALVEAFKVHIAQGGFGFLQNFQSVMVDEKLNDAMANAVRDHIKSIVKDPEVAEELLPFDHPVGTKRPCLDTDYYETYNRDNVTLVNIRKNPISAVTSEGIVAGGKEHKLDAIIYATGFDAVTGPLLHIDIRGRKGQSLRDKWAEGPVNYLGLMMAGFPNLFTVTGPLSPSVLANMPSAIDQHINWIVDCIGAMEKKGAVTIEARPDQEEAWHQHAIEVADMTLFPKANSWYMGSNIPGKKRTILPYLGGMIGYRAKCDEVAADDYRAFEVTA